MVVDLHTCETDVSWTHVYRFFPPVDSRRWYQVKTFASISGGKQKMGRVSLIVEEIREIAVQKAFVNPQDEVECLGSCYFGQDRR